jgi:peptidoglycan/xylan/chitin deacetylase (PgdA/CDA1 family)
MSSARSRPGHRCCTGDSPSIDLFTWRNMTARVLMATTFAMLLSFPLAAEKRGGHNDGRPAATVLCYHIVESPRDERMEISRETFRQHLQYLEMTGYTVIPLRHLYEYVIGERLSLPDNPVVITIDDGWRSAYTEAFPELKKRGFPFTLFIYPKIINKTPISLTWDQIREMQEGGADIQSHTLSHPYLSRRQHPELSDEQYAEWVRRELLESKKIIEKQTGRPVEFVAYPYGDYDSRVIAVAKKAGYVGGLTCVYGRVRKETDPLRMNRVVIDKSMDFADFRHYMGARPIEVADAKPAGLEIDPEQSTISARIPNFESLDPHSVGMALLTLGSAVPYAYDATTGAISMKLKDSIQSLQGEVHRAIVWARDAKSGKRVEASWIFKLRPQEPAAAAQPQTSGIAPAGGAR